MLSMACIMTMWMLPGSSHLPTAPIAHLEIEAELYIPVASEPLESPLCRPSFPLCNAAFRSAAWPLGPLTVACASLPAGLCLLSLQRLSLEE